MSGIVFLVDDLLYIFFNFISRSHKFSSAALAAELEIHTCADNGHFIASARVSFFHCQDIVRTNIHFMNLLFYYYVGISRIFSGSKDIIYLTKMKMYKKSDKYTDLIFSALSK